MSNKFGHGDKVELARHKTLGWIADGCVVCGRKVESNTLTVRFVNGGNEIYAATSTDEVDPSGDMGHWVVGSECAKKFADGVLYVGELA